MAEKRFLVMAWKWQASEYKTIEPTENRAQRIQFTTPLSFEEGKPKYAGRGVLLKMKELTFDEMEAGREKPGFAIVTQSQLEACKRARDVRVVGDIDALNNGLMPVREIPEVEDTEPFIDIPAMPEDSRPLQEEKLDCPFCADRKGFTRKSLVGHIDGFHLRALRGKKKLNAVEQDLWDALVAKMKELEDGA